MPKKRPPKNTTLVYSTHPEAGTPAEDAGETATPPPGEQKLRVSLDKKNRRGKKVTLVNGFVGSEGDLKDLARALKAHCGVGGSAKHGEILIQGDFREKIAQFLVGRGYKIYRL